MNRMVLGGLLALVMVGIGLFWLQGRAEVEKGAPPPDAPSASPGVDPEALPSADTAGMRGVAPPEADELTRDQQRFFRYDRNRDGKITRNEMLSTRTSSFRKLDTDGNNLLTFEEWAVATVTRFKEMDLNSDGKITQDEARSYYRKQAEAD